MDNDSTPDKPEYKTAPDLAEDGDSDAMLMTLTTNDESLINKENLASVNN